MLKAQITSLLVLYYYSFIIWLITPLLFRLKNKNIFDYALQSNN